MISTHIDNIVVLVLAASFHTQSEAELMQVFC